METAISWLIDITQCPNLSATIRGGLIRTITYSYLRIRKLCAH